jgi:hypothetical protein
MRKAFLLVLAVSLAAAGCSSKNPMSPTQSSRGNGVQTFVLQSPTDPRLPVPMLEATGATAADWAGLRAPSAASRDARTSRVAADPASFWNDQATQLGQRAALSGPLFARAHALTSIAVFDAIAASEDPRRGILPANAVAAGAASVVLGHLFPNELGAINDEANAQAGFRTQQSEGARGRAWALGRKVGRLVVERARTDGSNATFRGAIPVGVAKWSGARPQTPMAGTWKSWLCVAGAMFPRARCGTRCSASVFWRWVRPLSARRARSRTSMPPFTTRTSRAGTLSSCTGPHGPRSVRRGS